MRRKLAVGAVVVVVLAGVSAGIAIAGTRGGDDTRGKDDEPLTGSTLEKATAAALRHTGGGSVTETEAGDDGAAYGVEVRLDDGSEVEISLDADFRVVSEEADDDGAEQNGDEPEE
jgi:uncharacterized membrane protein YkoI